mmetsp:Transcript_7224/g.11774  ORF Transcript_7224/g.11774 Transcript_7224/m.11774 type:complete len:146 (-) Transcript_7224:126-563(-)|eukprot:CAMPEP_0169124706 /NCGR_PEP_ID=MMETSP1015-20121227/34468_1 /TAXON_ID=342587 /ORGANISM="Karlodinium micrum, Strain CCMP2283" /LENGTH=145 /DNA_ID=CAMNT_0009188141 /DNA_START=52 /DNA_END=489 /DNA_ORIENTATION=+
MADESEEFSDVKHLKGKYEWDNKGGENTTAENVVCGVIEKYSWADGTKNVSLYLDVADEVPDDGVSISNTSRSVTLVVQDKRLHIPNLAREISGATFARKKGKNQLVVKLAKKDTISWTKLVEEVVNKDSGLYTKEDAKTRVTPA